MLKIWRMENAFLMKLQSCCLIGTRHLFWFLCRLCKQKPMTVFCRYSSLLFTFGYCKPQFQGLITHSHSHFFFPWPAVLVFMKTLLKEWPGCTYYCHAKSTETCLHWSLPKVSRKNGSQHTSVKNKLETFSEGLAGVFGALCLSPGFQMLLQAIWAVLEEGCSDLHRKPRQPPRHLRDSRDHGWHYGAVQLFLAPMNLGRWQVWLHPICLGEIYVISSPHVMVWLKNSPNGLLFAMLFLWFLWALQRRLHCLCCL